MISIKLKSIVITLMYLSLSNCSLVQRYDNQTQFEEAKIRLDGCVERYNISAKLYASTVGHWELRFDQNKNYTEQNQLTIEDCLFGDGEFYIVVAPDQQIEAVDDENASYSSLGPDYLPPVDDPIMEWPNGYFDSDVVFGEYEEGRWR